VAEKPDPSKSRGKGQTDQPANKRRLAHLKRQIRRGDYETPEKLDVTLRRLLADLRGVEAGARPRRGDDTGGESP
jgi:hypothetical protein